MDFTEAEIDEMSKGDKIDELLAECGLYDGEGSPSTDEKLANEILDAELPMFGDGSFETFRRRIGAKPDGGFEAEAHNSRYSLEAEADSEALVIAKLLAKYCMKQGSA